MAHLDQQQGQTHQSQISVEGIFVLWTNDFVQVVSCRVSRRDFRRPVKDGNIGIACVGEVQSCGQSPCPATDDDDSSSLVLIHRGGSGSQLDVLLSVTVVS